MGEPGALVSRGETPSASEVAYALRTVLSDSILRESVRFPSRGRALRMASEGIGGDCEFPALSDVFGGSAPEPGPLGRGQLTGGE